MPPDVNVLRARTPVLVPQAESLGALGVIRSLGRAGYPVHASASDPSALGLHSSFVARRHVSPRPEAPGYADWLQRTTATHGIRFVVPSEAVLLAVRSRASEFLPLFPLAPCVDALYAGLSKYDLFATLEGMEGLPPMRLVPDLEAPLSAASLGELGKPLWIKVDGVHARDGSPGRVVRAVDAVDAVAALRRLAPSYGRAIVQGHVPGDGVGAFALLRAGEPLATFAHRRLHEVPHTGGVSSLRESWRHPTLEAHALAALRKMHWSGVAMVEYRWDPRTGAYWLMEMNGRFWGSLHLALAAGVDFPRLLLDAALGLPVSSPERREGVRCRHTVPGELWHLWSLFRDRQVSALRKGSALAEFVALGLDPRVHSDLAFPGDRRLWWRELGRCLRTEARRRLRGGKGGNDGSGQAVGVPGREVAGVLSPGTDRHAA